MNPATRSKVSGRGTSRREVCGNITHVKNNGGGNKAKGGDGGGGSRGLKPEEKRGCRNHSFTLDIISAALLVFQAGMERRETGCC